MMTLHLSSLSLTGQGDCFDFGRSSRLHVPNRSRPAAALSSGGKADVKMRRALGGRRYQMRKDSMCLVHCAPSISEHTTGVLRTPNWIMQALSRALAALREQAASSRRALRTRMLRLPSATARQRRLPRTESMVRTLRAASHLRPFRLRHRRRGRWQ